MVDAQDLWCAYHIREYLLLLWWGWWADGSSLCLSLYRNHDVYPIQRILEQYRKRSGIIVQRPTQADLG